MRILAAIERAPSSPSRLANTFDLPVEHVAYHVKMLVQYGMLRLQSTERRGGATEHLYELVERPRIDNTAWGRMSRAERTETVHAVLGPTGEMVERALAADGFNHAASVIVRLWLDLDEQGYEEASALLATVIERLKGIERDAAARIADGADPMRAAAVALLFEEAPDEPGSGAI